MGRLVEAVDEKTSSDEKNKGLHNQETNYDDTDSRLEAEETL